MRATMPAAAVFVSFVAAFVLTIGFSMSDASAQQADRPPVSWVNPELPDGPGLSHHVLKSEALGHDVGYVVWTPPGYDDNAEQRYPVIYFLHGMGGNEAADSAGFSSYVARGIEQGTIPPVLVVFPNGGRSGYRGEVETMIVEELVPHIDREYRTIGDRAQRLLAGFSMGSAGGMRLLMAHPHTFSAAAGWGGVARVENLESSTPDLASLQNDNAAFFIVIGDQERSLDAARNLAQQLEQNDVTHELVVLDNQDHNLGEYYQRTGDQLVAFLGKRLNAAAE